ncbi:putative monovalent cation/H+ antiporter subunit A [Halorhodospira halochloris]|uniref:Na(+) H(+) antiporter subunit A n=1 Tax=Halorhodospira halochloris TaxID=1052 RepID=A0A0X8XAE9_HALHR|nr:putative monovalent cation/H+ antiporter subunit A [Halorhodospira halochloris]MBK1652135.1 Na(+)/H(+) antiporter subunit A [Halorhodospira halochloris]MCG5530563.1 putative monovalent cation/H+ antiporter subunit A [Halorhodospira halochloris]MCG5547855.1 putative monovalent cation/H+ antiporter subunit A [Halorhodospira halochloris]BAU58447.1 Na(+) H(+) antiporter subunit A [Halorhodospira halochloris]
MLLAVISGFILAALVPWLHHRLGDRAGWFYALLPAVLTVYFASFLPQITAGDTAHFHYTWAPGLDLDLSFYVDGLSLLFALLISGIGTFILIYASDYLAGDERQPRFYVHMLAFMASMLGLVLSDNLIALFIFWELTSITSYMLIGYDHESKYARKCALQGLIVTFGGGLALLAGFIMMAVAGDSYTITELLNNGDVIREHDWYLPLLLLILIGAFTKSAQWPFHFWLPNAMAAPTPVSAYLHSATMVKAGVYLLARLHPAIGATEAWIIICSLFGAVTMLTGAYLAVRSTQIKRVLAYSTVMALGTLTMLAGIGTEKAMIAFGAFLLAHSLYKGSLFMVAGALDHETGTKDVTKMRGLVQAMPLTAIAAAVSALSLAGIPPLFGFIGKELMLESVVAAPHLATLLTVMATATAVLVVAVAAIVAVRPFYGELSETPKQPHEPPYGMLAGPAVLGLLGLFFGLAPGVPGESLIAATASSLAGEPIEANLALWHGVNLPLILSLFAILVGAIIYLNWERVRGFMARFDWLHERGPEAGYEKMMDGMVWSADWQTRILQNGYLRHYITTTVLTLVVLVGYTLITRFDGSFASALDVRFYEWIVAGVLVAAAIFACRTDSRLGSVAAIGVVGFAIALLFILFSAPDLGITQILVETLTVILLVLVLFRLPGFMNFSTPLQRLRDAAVAGVLGVLVTALLLVTIDYQFAEPISQYHLEQSVPLAHGHNVVNVILVDYRALDTLGEIFVVALAAIGVFAMLKYTTGSWNQDRRRQEEEGEES